MKSIHDVETLLELIHRKPAMFWGGGPFPFTSFAAFFHGYKFGSGTSPDSPISPEKLIPPEFHRFVAKRLRGKPNGMDWFTLIREHTASEEEAFDLFFKLRREYEQQLSRRKV